MSLVYSIWFGKVSKIQDPQVWAISIDLIGQSEFGGEDGIYALPLGSITSKIEVDDPVVAFQLDDRPGSYYYLPMKKGDGRIGLFNKKTYLDLTDPDNLILSAQGKTYMVHKGDLFVNVNSKIKLNGPGKIEAPGIPGPPNPQGGAFNSQLFCLYAGTAHCSDTLTLTNPPEQVPETEAKE